MFASHVLIAFSVEPQVFYSARAMSTGASVEDMGLFDKFKKGWKVGKTWEKTWGNKSTTPEQERAPPQGEQGRYGRLAAWIKTRYGNRFMDGATSTEVETQLENILKELETTEDFKKHPKMATGFRTYISDKKYGDLVRVSE
jgi:hypothetical protein